ncbi:MAG TPA: hypothetical protein VMV33_17105 [Rhodocyclaceae bacterium]|nr:hypothetical protein [Rhodocyclaceae bacterium]
MTYSSILTDYLGEGAAASRPATLSIAPTALGFFFAIDTGVLSAWDGTGVAWVDIGSGTVTTIIAGSGLAGGTITSSGTISLAGIAAGSLMGNAAATVDVPGAIAVGLGLTLAVGGTLEVDTASIPVLDGSGFIPFAEMQPQIENSPVVFPFIGSPAGSALLAFVAAVQKTILPANLAGTVLVVNGTADLPTSAATVTLDTLSSGTWTNQGTIGISTTGSLTLPVFAAVTLDPVNGDAFRLVNQPSADATFGNFAFGIQMKKVAG